jgi:hypothetical protein
VENCLRVYLQLEKLLVRPILHVSLDSSFSTARKKYDWIRGALSWKEGIYQEHWGIQILYSRYYYHPQTSYDILPRSPRVYWCPQSRSLDIVYVTLHVSQQRTTRNQTELENVSFQTKQKQKSWNQCPDSNVVNCPPVVRAGITEGGGAVGGATLSKFPL